MAFGEGIKVGVDTVAPFMNEQNSAANIKAFAQKFRSWFGNDKAKALKDYQFGNIGQKAGIPFGRAADQSKYVADALAVGPHVKDLLKQTLVNNYFATKPVPMKFSIGSTSTAGGDLEVGQIQNAKGETFLSVRILCELPGPKH
jgi:hypothetical protein